MTNVFSRVLTMSILTCALCLAQADDSQPAVTNVRGAAYPRVHGDLRVTFQFKAPAAQKVQLQPGGNDNGLGTGPIDMTRGADGTWTVTIPPAVSGFHYYWFLVDGIIVNDPGSETFFGYARETTVSTFPKKAPISMPPKTCLTAMYACTGITQKRRPHGAVPWCIRRRITTAM